MKARARGRRCGWEEKEVKKKKKKSLGNQTHAWYFPKL